MLLCFWRVARPSHLEWLWADGVDDALTAVQHPLPWAVGSQSNSRDSQLPRPDYSPSFVPRRLNLLCDARLCLKVPYYTFFFFFQIQICKNLFRSPEAADLIVCFQPPAATDAWQDITCVWKKTETEAGWRRQQPQNGINEVPAPSVTSSQNK